MLLNNNKDMAESLKGGGGGRSLASANALSPKNGQLETCRDPLAYKPTDLLVVLRLLIGNT